ncbi:ABC transporter substrate-binding protein [Pseudoroseomonas wenyumeiae]|uniref:ABC transporter substrate-binding protein n=1 Tax=Teichococcus wenyumeiae TaxID=2478470 RepID=A0A3A9J986_9PROT|nr:ABC transporter substrate-binding protein [Pseudoroseomonas wenyumeiae]RKK02992.1 ABC transporter substrate-binding protein [Pseudoroseomonas wenyumeiae]RMI15514.1 ABC transporter substrate-binding protein [Pseudoroseomonas wenyumeiae]
MSTITASRRGVLAGMAALALPAATWPRPAAAQQKPLTVMLESEVVILDPHMTTAAITRTFAYHVFDMLYGSDAAGRVHPQMVDSHEVSADGLQWRFTLRPGLRFHDDAPVTAGDCVASLARWAPRDALGRMLLAAGATMAAQGERVFTITLTKPFPLMLSVLGKPNAPLPVIMPARVAAAAGEGRIKDIIGSGPFRFVVDRWKVGDSMVLARFEGYVPRQEPADFLSGGKVVQVPQVVLRAIGDDTTGANALVTGEIDYMQYLPFDLVPMLARSQGVKVMTLKGLDMFQGNFRLNAASGPFADPAVRAVLWKLVDQKEMLQAAGIEPGVRMDHCAAFFMCDAPLASDAGAGSAKFDPAAGKAALARTGYKGEPVVMLQVAGSISQAAGSLLAQRMREAGFTVDEQVMDWGTVLQRRSRKEGWSVFPVYSNGVDMASPLTHFYVSNNCADYTGWSCSEPMSELLIQFAAAPDDAARARIAAAIQEDAYRTTPTVMWGQFSRPAGYRSRLQGLVQSSFPIFWGVRLADA